MAFSIRLLPKDKASHDKVRLGEIKIGDFTERFSVYPILRPIEHVAARWKSELCTLLVGTSPVGLPTASNMTWVFYRFDQKVLIHQMMINMGRNSARLSRTMKVIGIPPYSAEGP